MEQKRRLSIWITGSAGFLGTRLANHLTATGHRVTGLSRQETRLIDKSVVIDLAADDACEQLRGLIQKTDAPDVLIHAASKQPGSGELREFIRSNVRTTENLIAAFRARPPGQIIYTSTQSVYNHPATLPVKETEPCAGSLPYSATKRWSEQLLENFKNEVPVTVLRLPSLFGAGQADSFIDGLAAQAMLDRPIELFSRGEIVRDAVHVTDVVKAIATCAENRFEESFSLFNLGCGRPINTLEYARTLVGALESKSAVIPVDKPASQPNLYADIEKARRMIGFEPTPLAESMRIYANELSAR
jgi:nucleoside-diphosphate-sugar epimerase